MLNSARSFTPSESVPNVSWAENVSTLTPPTLTRWRKAATADAEPDTVLPSGSSPNQLPWTLQRSACFTRAMQ